MAVGKHHRAVLLLLLTLLTSPSQLRSQQSNTFYLMHELPQSNLMNPAVQIQCKYHVGFPFLSSAHASYTNTAFTYKDLTDGDRWNIETVQQQMHRSDLYSAESMYVPLDFGYRFKRNYFTFHLAERVHGFSTIPGDLPEVAVHGNAAFVGEKASFNGLRPGGAHHREYALGVSRVLGPYLTAGIRAKLLFGKAGAGTGRTNIGLFTAEDNFSLTMDADYTLHTSFPYTITTDEEGNITDLELEEINTREYLLNRSNPGFALDLGLIYQFNERITLSASLLDLGFLRWRSDLNNIHVIGEYAFEGIDADTEVFSTAFMEDIVNDMLDSLDTYTSQDPFTTMLPTQVILGGSYQYSKKIAFGLVNRNVIFRSKLHSSFTLSARADLAERFLGVLSWSYLNNSLANVGVGLAYHGKGWQLHAVSDNVLGFFYPFNSRTLNLRVGMNLMLGCPRNKRERLQEASYGRLPRGGECPFQEDPAKERRKHQRAARRINR